jgi:hypothetical protein
MQRSTLSTAQPGNSPTAAYHESDANTRDFAPRMDAIASLNICSFELWRMSERFTMRISFTGMFALHVLQLHTRRSAKWPGREASADALLGPLFFSAALAGIYSPIVMRPSMLASAWPAGVLRSRSSVPLRSCCWVSCGHPCWNLTAAFCGHPCFYRSRMFARRVWLVLGCCTSTSNVVALKATHGRDR